MSVHEKNVALRENFLRLTPSFWATTNLRNPSNRGGRAGEVPTRQEQRKQERKQANIIFNVVRRFAYVVEVRKRDFIDSTINYKRIQEIIQGIFFRIQFMRAKEF